MSRLRTLVLAMVVAALVIVFGAGTVSATETAKTNLIFIHHSVGSNWLGSGLSSALNARGYYVADITYGWTGGSGTVYGDRTDTTDWPTWFTNGVMARVYPELDTMSAGNSVYPAPGGQNTIVMFKSCYPNSNVGASNADEKAIYNSLLPYFQAHPEKMFVLVTPPPMRSISSPTVTRALCDWLVDRDNGWLKDLTTGNVFVFDLYNVLTHPDAHHRLSGGVESHVARAGSNTLYSGYHPAGDDHPNNTGNAKATAEFAPLLDLWYQQFLVSTGLQFPRYQQTDPLLTYLGDWATGYTWSASGGSYASTQMDGAALLVTFEGTSVDLLGRTTPWYGRAAVSLDGGAPETIDFYSAAPAYKQVVRSFTELSEGQHTLRIECLREKHPDSLGFAIGLDAFDIDGHLTQADRPTRYQQDDGHFVYTGAWDKATTWSASGGTYLTSDQGDSAVSVSFTGTYLAWVARTTPWYGKAKVSVDGGALQTVDLYSASTTWKKKVYDTGLLADGPHTLHIYWTGEKNPASLGTRVSIDTLDLFGAPTAAAPAPAIACRYQDNDPRITYVGDWSLAADRAASGGSFRYTRPQADMNSAALFSFHGSDLTLFCRTTPWYGWADVEIDGVVVATLDLYSRWVVPGAAVYQVSGLSEADHAVALRYRSTRSDQSAGYSISLDAIETDGYLLE